MCAIPFFDRAAIEVKSIAAGKPDTRTGNLNQPSNQTHRQRGALRSGHADDGDSSVLLVAK